ncbi:hypothetical protein [Mariniplasma anaerobium]|uniref:Uncharacterized protein n=1 Tax=Mariniplasma anaerobium TaxID=2735436 RepID=A0A7U9TK84_9MOLU|nr:hypothetical protein [Mariniplasma anaerobium]BCR36130.1 hypothetical protein MPAN_010230 [Mariniplasma anaerobium]
MSDYEFNVWKNNVSNEFMKMGVKFFKTSKMLFEKMINEPTPKHLDQLIFPCLYSFRHSLELILKHVLIDECSEKEDVLAMLKTNKHNLLSLFAESKHIIVCSKVDIDEFDKLIDYINKIDPFSDYFRYPFGLYGDYNFENQIWIDLNKLYNSFEIANSLFDLIINDNKPKFKGNSKPVYFVSETQVKYSTFSTIGTGGLSKSFRYQMNGFNQAAEFLMEYDDYYIQRLYFERLSIELVLKDIIFYIMNEESFKIFRKKTHSIIGLWNKVISILDELKAGAGSTEELSDVDELKNIKGVLEKIHEQDLNSDQFRYPITNDGNLNLSIIEEDIEDLFDKGSLFGRLEKYDNAVLASDLNNKGMSLYDYLMEL